MLAYSEREVVKTEKGVNRECVEEALGCVNNLYTRKETKTTQL